jgi:orotidine-5'-phosphate decarboxylase
LETSFGDRLANSFAIHGQLCVGLDPSVDQLSSWGLPVSAAGVEQFCVRMMEACEGSIGILKPQVAFFEQFGAEGFTVLEKVLTRASESNYLVIADAKRGDIGSTMAGYARAWLASDAPFLADALTLSPYLGAESLAESIDIALQNQRGVFMLSATSNLEAFKLQSAIETQGRSVAADIALVAGGFNSNGNGSVGLVIGAQVDRASIGLSDNDLIGTPILSPGFGAQGALLSTARSIFGQLSESVIFSVSRSIAGNSATYLRNRVLTAKAELEAGLSN